MPKKAALLCLGFLLLILPILGSRFEKKQSRSSYPLRASSLLSSQQADHDFKNYSGQSLDWIKYYTRISGGAAYISHRGDIIYSRNKTADQELYEDAALKPYLIETFLNGKIKAIEGQGKCEPRVNYFKESSNPDSRTSQAAYSQIDLGQVYRGVEVKLQIFGNKVEKLFCLKPGSNPKKIRIKLIGASELKLNSDGDMIVKTKAANLAFSRPTAFQVICGRYKPVEIAYSIRGNTYGFKIGEYNKNQVLIIDPMITSSLSSSKDAITWTVK